MSESILDNQEVTAEILNNISIDLGNDDLTFTSTEKFGADKLNKITGDLVGAGILTGGTNHGNNCKIYISNGKIYVKSGIMVFADGKKKTIEKDTEIADVQSSCVVYALNDVSLNKIEIAVSSNYPSSGDFVKLATIKDGAVLDNRNIAMSKVNALGSRVSQKVTGTIKTQLEIPLNGLNPGVVYGSLNYGSYNAVFIYNITDNLHYQCTATALTACDYIYVGGYPNYVTFSVTDDKLIATSQSTGAITLSAMII